MSLHVFVRGAGVDSVLDSGCLFPRLELRVLVTERPLSNERVSALNGMDR